jgi:hypothetical protein
VQLPFTRTEFFDVFGAYNSALWPAALALWVLSIAVLVFAARARKPPDRALSALLTVHWVWSALAFHAAFFTAVNPMAWAFAALFSVQAAALAWHGVIRRRIRFSTGHSWRDVIGGALISYALAYPLINLAQADHVLLREPTFGVPCPTTILTIGLLLPAAMPSWRLAVIPIIWSVIAGSASFFFGVYTDLVLLLAAPMWVISLAMPGPPVNQEASCSASA